MADKNDGGDKTEKPTPKRLRDARKKGDVPKSKDVTSTAGVLVAVLVGSFAFGFVGERLITLFDLTFDLMRENGSFNHAARSVGWEALIAFSLLSAAFLVPIALGGTIAEFLQAGMLITFEKLKPSLDKLNPVEGFKRMFSMDNLVELVKTVAKATLILALTYIIIRAAPGELYGRIGPQMLPLAPGGGQAAALQALIENERLGVRLLATTLAVFFFVALLDYVYQRHSYIKKMKMSLRDIREEFKQNEGDPHVKGQRKQLHQEWANQNAVQSARTANVLVVNPTHIAVALDYDPDSTPVPVIAAMGEGPLAQAMREAAEEAGVPIIRHVDVARTLFERGTIDHFVPRDMFEAIAEIILWAKREREARLRPPALPGR